MTVIALIARRNVSRGLSGRRDPVMTRYAAAGQGRMVDKSDSSPTCRDVAVRTLAVSLNMSWRFRRSPDDTALGMTTRARRVGRPKGSGYVAAITSYACVCAVKNEAGAEMVEGLL